MSTEQIPPDVVVMLKKMYPTGFATPWLLELQDVLDRNWIRQEDAGNRLKDRLNRSVVDILMKGHSMAYWDTFLYPNDRISSPLAVGLRGKVIQTRLQISGLIGKRVDWGASEDQAIKKLRQEIATSNTLQDEIADTLYPVYEAFWDKDASQNPVFFEQKLSLLKAEDLETGSYDAEVNESTQIWIDLRRDSRFRNPGDNLPKLLMNPIMVRKTMALAYRELELRLGTSNSCRLVAHPMIGCSTMAYYILFNRLMRKKATILQIPVSRGPIPSTDNKYAFYLFNENGVYCVTSSAILGISLQEPWIWIIVDGFYGELIRTSGNVKEVFVHPFSIDYEDLCTRYTINEGDQFSIPVCLDLWTLEEIMHYEYLISGKTALSITDMEVIHKKFKASGPSLATYRMVHSDLSSQSNFTNRTKKDVLRRLASKLGDSEVGDMDMKNLLRNFLRQESHMWPFGLFFRKRETMNTSTDPNSSASHGHSWYVVEFGSKADARNVLADMDNLNKLRAKKIYEFLMMDALGSTSLGWLFEARQHRQFAAGKKITVHLTTEHKKNMEFIDGFLSSIPQNEAKLLREAKGKIICRNFTLETILKDPSDSQGPTATVFSSIEDLTNILKRYNRDTLDLLHVSYFQPGISNQAAFDALTFRRIVVRKGGKDHVYLQLVAIQYTVGKKHPLKAHGLKKLWDALPARFRSKDKLQQVRVTLRGLIQAYGLSMRRSCLM